MERTITHSFASTSYRCSSGTIFARRKITRRQLHAQNLSVQASGSLDDQAEELARTLPTSEKPKSTYQDALKSVDAAEIQALLPTNNSNLFADVDDIAAVYDGADAGETLFNGSLSPQPLDSEYYIGEVSSFRSMDRNPAGRGPSGQLLPPTAPNVGKASVESMLGVPKELTREEAALEQYQLETAVDAAMATHHAIREGAYNIYGVTLRFAELLEAMDFQDVVTPAPRLAGTNQKVPGWIRAEDAVLEELDELNEQQRLMDDAQNEAELQRIRDTIAEEVDAAVKLLAETNPQAGVTYEESPEDDDILNDLLGGLLPGTEDELLEGDFANDIMPGASSMLHLENTVIPGEDTEDDTEPTTSSKKRGPVAAVLASTDEDAAELEEEEDEEAAVDEDIIDIVLEEEVDDVAMSSIDTEEEEL